MEYERVTYRPEGASRSRTVFLQDTVESDFLSAKVLRGQEVYKDGALADRMHIIEMDLIRKRTSMRMNLHCGELEKL